MRTFRCLSVSLLGVELVGRRPLRLLAVPTVVRAVGVVMEAGAGAGAAVAEIAEAAVGVEEEAAEEAAEVEEEGVEEVDMLVLVCLGSCMPLSHFIRMVMV